MMLEIIKRSISSSIILGFQAENRATEARLCFRETDSNTSNRDITISFNKEVYDCIGLDFSNFNANNNPITNIYERGAEKVNKVSDGLIIGRENGSDEIFAIILEMKSKNINTHDVKLQLNGTQAIFEYINNLIKLQFGTEYGAGISLYRFCFSLKNLKPTRDNPLGGQWNESSRSYTLGKQNYYNIRHFFKYKLPSE